VLVVFFRPESVDLAIQMLDDTDFRFGVSSASGRMKVQAADFSYKAQQEAPVKKNARDKRKIIKKTQRLNKYVGCANDGHDAKIRTANLPIGMMIRLRFIVRVRSMRNWLFSSICLPFRSSRRMLPPF